MKKAENVSVTNFGSTTLILRGNKLSNHELFTKQKTRNSQLQIDSLLSLTTFKEVSKKYKRERHSIL